MDDSDLLRKYAANRSEDAFAHLVAAYSHLVYSAALRILRDPAQADRATQAAFILLARQAPALSRQRTLLPFLYEAACRAADAIRGQSNGDLAPASGGTLYTAPSDWASLSPRIDAALMRLPGRERSAVLLKYLAGLSLRDTAETLGLDSTTAAQRCASGVARIRRALEAHNQFVSAEALVAAMQAHAIRPAPDFAVQNAAYAALTDHLSASARAAGRSNSTADAPGAIAGGVAAAMRRTRLISAGLNAAIVLVTAALAIVLVIKLREMAGPAPIAGNPPAPPRTVAAGGQGGAAPGTTQVVAPPQPPLPPPPPVEPGPAVRPEKPVDPVIAGQLMEAIRAGDFAEVEFVCREAPDAVNAIDPVTRKRAVAVAADLVDWQRRDSARIAHYLIEHGAAVDAYVAARAGHARAVHWIIAQRPATLDRPDDGSGLTPIQCAALIPGGSPECENTVDRLIQLGARVDVFTACAFGRLEDAAKRLEEHPKLATARCLGATALHWAARTRRYADDPLAIPRLLLEKGADPIARDDFRDGATPLHDAAGWADQPAVVQLLLDKGVDVNIKDDLGLTPLDYARARGRTQTVALLESKGGKRTTVDYPDLPSKTARFLAAVRAGDAKLVTLLINDTPELAATRGPTGETPLHLAAALGHHAVIDALLAEKVDLNAPETNRFGGTPLHWAARQNRLETVKYLVSKGADARSINKRTGQTALHVVARHAGDRGLAEYLMAQGVDASIKDHLGKTAADYAKQFIRDGSNWP